MNRTKLIGSADSENKTTQVRVKTSVHKFWLRSKLPRKSIITKHCIHIFGRGISQNEAEIALYTPNTSAQLEVFHKDTFVCRGLICTPSAGAEASYGKWPMP
jgi:hypothetical protein